VSVPQWLFVAGVFDVLLVLNALHSVRYIAVLVVPSFFAAWLPIEAPWHVAVLMLLVLGGLLSAGGLAGWLGWGGLLMVLLSLVGLLCLHRRGADAAGVVEVALQSVLGGDYRDRLRVAGVLVDPPLPRGRLLVPLWLSDPAVELLRDIPYVGDGNPRHRLDIRRAVGCSSESASPAPVLLQIHGGGWVVGHKAQQGRPLMNTMARAGWLCVAINYRLSPKARWPDHLVDAKRALVWVKQHIASYGGDPGFIIVSGGSAGGHLAAMLGLTANQPRWQPGFEQADTRVQGVVPCYGVYDLIDRERQWCYRGWRWFLQQVVMPRQSADDMEQLMDDASPLSWIGPQAPPFLIVHGQNDSLVCARQARVFADHLARQSMQSVGLLLLPGAQHAFDLFHSPRALAVTRGIHRYAELLRLDYQAKR